MSKVLPDDLAVLGYRQQGAYILHPLDGPPIDFCLPTLVENIVAVREMLAAVPGLQAESAAYLAKRAGRRPKRAVAPSSAQLAMEGL